ncbi:metallophosphoesterase [Rheinheimera sp. 1928-s]|uniref:metallophosphoesterase n=1 Tax=Rheinheimera sp. 1928-s TaxID=3033803 RepID=UPI002614AE6C|nr:metallophosphoesterase [Rheinheimera sp. 1928-s]MDF3126776.1 serine/threonine protein phosphatase [Rheinheimera sp. 1928-s]
MKTSFSLFVPLVLSVLLSACSPADSPTEPKQSSPQAQVAPVTAPVAATPAEAGSVVLAFAVLGDAEPKPEPQFPNLAAAVADVNQLTEPLKLSFVVGVGDIAHKGTQIQYENATPVLQQLKLPFYPIMGNEEHGSTVERFMQFANLWNQGKVTIDSPSYVLEYDEVALVFASPDHGRDFNDQGISWILGELKRLNNKAVLLIVHGAQAGVYPENAEKGIHHPGFADVITQPNLVAVISGDLHMDMDRVAHSKQLGQVHYLHIPALERTKIPDETKHTPMFRVFSLNDKGIMQVDTYQTGVATPLPQHSYSFSIKRAS